MRTWRSQGVSGSFVVRVFQENSKGSQRHFRGASGGLRVPQEISEVFLEVSGTFQGSTMSSPRRFRWFDGAAFCESGGSLGIFPKNKTFTHLCGLHYLWLFIQGVTGLLDSKQLKQRISSMICGSNSVQATKYRFQIALVSIIGVPIGLSGSMPVMP